MSRSRQVIRCIVFDFDGTLVDSNYIKRSGFVDVVKEFSDGPRLMESILNREDAGDRYWVFETFASSHPADISAQELVDRYSDLCETKITEAPEISGAEDVLTSLKANGVFLCVNSATPLIHLRVIVKRRRMGHLFDGVFGAPKSKEENLVSIMSEFQLDPADVLMVGDSEADRVAAERTGCQFLAIANTDNNFGKVPLRHIHDYSEMSGDARDWSVSR